MGEFVADETYLVDMRDCLGICNSMSEIEHRHLRRVAHAFNSLLQGGNLKQKRYCPSGDYSWTKAETFNLPRMGRMS